MIRINLISEGRRPVAAKESSDGGGGIAGIGGSALGGIDLGTLLLVGLLLAALSVFLVQNFLLGRELRGLKTEVADAQAEVDRLAPIIKEVEEFKIKKAELERKVQVINDLRNNQHGPVRLMDQVSRALPELLWLDKMDVIGTSVQISGEAFNPNAVAHFIENLERVPEFQEPDTGTIAKKGSIYNFVVNFNFTPTPLFGDGTDQSDVDGEAEAAE